MLAEDDYLTGALVATITESTVCYSHNSSHVLPSLRLFSQGVVDLND